MSKERKQILAGLEDIQETLEEEITDKDLENVPDNIKSQIYKSFGELYSAVFAVVGYSTIHPNND